MDAKELERIDRETIDLLKSFQKASDRDKLLMINSKMWIVEDIISERLIEKNYEEIGKLYRMLRSLTRLRSIVKNEKKTY